MLERRNTRREPVQETSRYSYDLLNPDELNVPTCRIRSRASAGSTFFAVQFESAGIKANNVFDLNGMPRWFASRVAA
jgi:hypothetical protein